MNIEKIRNDFPILQKIISGKPIVYFDNACVTLKPTQVVDAIVRYYEEFPACAGRSAHKLGRMVTEEVEKSREKIAKFIGAKTKEIVFTRNTTEGINLVAHSLPLNPGDIVLTTDKEHNSNLLPWQLLRERKKIAHEIVQSSADNTFDIEKFKEKMSKNVKLVSMVHTSNLDGVSIPAKEIIKIAHDAGALVLLDGAQSVPHKEINVKKLGIDFLAWSGHKMLGPSGIGALYGKYELLEELNPFLVGGDTVKDSTYTSHILLEPPEKFEAGLQDYAGIIGFAAAVDYLKGIGLGNIEKHEKELNKIITQGIIDIKGIKIIGPSAELRSGIVSFNIEGFEPHEIALMLDEENIFIRSGQHCVHSWFNAHKISGSARASLYVYNTRHEAEKFVEQIKKIAQLR